MLYFIVNPNAGNGRGGKIWGRLERRLRFSGVEYQAMITEAPGDSQHYIRQLTDNSHEPLLIVAVGGDGTFNEVLNGLPFSGQVTLGYIPTGSDNDLARCLGLPGSPRRCLKKLLKSQGRRTLDYGVLTYEAGTPVHRRFLVSSGIGYDAAVSHALLNTRSKGRLRFPHRGRFGYVLMGLRQIFRTKPVSGYLMLDGVKRVEFNHIYFVTAHILPYKGRGFCFAPKADASDGLLEVCVFHQSSRWKLIPALRDISLGRVRSHAGLRTFRCQELQVHLDSPMPVHTDGESCFCQTDITMHCIKQKLRVVV